MTRQCRVPLVDGKLHSEWRKVHASVCACGGSCEWLTNDRNKYNATVHFSAHAPTSHHAHVSIWVQIRNKWKPNNKLSCLLSTTEKTDNVGMQLHATFADTAAPAVGAWPGVVDTCNQIWNEFRLVSSPRLLVVRCM